VPYWEFVSKLPTAVRDGAVTLKTPTAWGMGGLPLLFNNDLWKESNFGRIHLAGENLESVRNVTYVGYFSIT
jgi:hypothetical protein